MEKPGQVAKVTKTIAEQGGNFVSFVQFSGDDQYNRLVTIEVNRPLIDDLRGYLVPIVEKVLVIRNN